MAVGVLLKLDANASTARAKFILIMIGLLPRKT
jgi:hypothetical protein